MDRSQTLLLSNLLVRLALRCGALLGSAPWFPTGIPAQVTMADEQSNAAAGQQSLYPSPPPFYKLYREDADGTAERPLPPNPPAPLTGEYRMFGEVHTVGLRSD